MENIHEIIKRYWGFDSFRPMQEEIIQTVLKHEDALALLPTGGGKSLCYQVPGMAMPGLCLVISPLIALMKDQVDGLRKKGITAFALYAGMTRKEVLNALKVAGSSNCKFLYVSPERLESNLFKEYLPGLHVSLIAVDEAHCISQWGYDFRPPYLRVGELRKELPGVPVLALTASATPVVQDDICDRLGFNTRKIFRQSFERPRLSYSVFKSDAKINRIAEILERVPGTAIVYCKSRKRCKEISDLLQLRKISAAYYHAGLSSDERSQRQQDWISNQIRVIVCTNAFGMGIDKPDVRVVIHADPPDCMEHYYQEAGRAGRDGKNAYAVLLYDERDLLDMEDLPRQRFPEPDAIRHVYQALANYLQLPSGEGQGQYFAFDLADFVKKFKLQTYSVIYALKTLEQEGWLSFNEQVFLSATVQFTTDRERLEQLEQEEPHLSQLAKTLLRTYEGIFDNPVAISEKLLAGLTRSDPHTVTAQLLRLHLLGVVLFQPQKDDPQLYFIRNRIRAEELQIDGKAYMERKKQLTERIASMTGFIRDNRKCRSKSIGAYFGDDRLGDCGICDNCLNAKATEMSGEEFEKIRMLIEQKLSSGPLHADALLALLAPVKKEKAWKVIDHLQAEQYITTDNRGWVRWNRSE